VSSDPLAACEALGDDVQGLTCKAFAHLLSGYAPAACDLFERASFQVVDAVWDLVIRLGHTAASLLAATDDDERRRVARRCLPLAAEADRLGIAWLNRQAHCLLALVGQTEMAADARRRCRADGDQWGEVLAGIFEGAGRLLAGEAPTELLAETASLARSLGAGVLEAIAMAEHAAALFAEEYPDSDDAALSAEAAARRAALPGAQALCHAVLAGCRQQSDEHFRYASILAEECGLGILGLRSAARPIMAKESTARSDTNMNAQPRFDVQIRCFGALEVHRDGIRVDDSALRPRARALLALLALHHPVPVHVDVLIESLWPDADYDAAAHRMQTAVSSLRRLLQGDVTSVSAPGDRTQALVRRGAAYVLQHVGTDLDEFQIQDREAAAAKRDGERSREVAALRRMLSLYDCDLFSEFGPAEWLVRERDRLRLAAADAAERLAELELEAGSHSAAMSVARRGLALDCYRESLWRLAELTAERMADPVAAARLRTQRVKALSELDLCID
jgi:DNA-binding SARP family transcriptional activator